MLLKVKEIDVDFDGSNILDTIRSYKNNLNRLLNIMNGNSNCSDNNFYSLIDLFFEFNWSEFNQLMVSEIVLNSNNVKRDAVNVSYLKRSYFGDYITCVEKIVYSNGIDNNNISENDFLDNILDKKMIYLYDNTVRLNYYDYLKGYKSLNNIPYYEDYILSEMTPKSFLYKKELRDVIEEELENNFTVFVNEIFDKLNDKINEYEEKQNRILNNLKENYANNSGISLDYNISLPRYEKEISDTKDLTLKKNK